MAILGDYEVDISFHGTDVIAGGYVHHKWRAMTRDRLWAWGETPWEALSALLRRAVRHEVQHAAIAKATGSTGETP